VPRRRFSFRADVLLRPCTMSSSALVLSCDVCMRLLFVHVGRSSSTGYTMICSYAFLSNMHEDPICVCLTKNRHWCVKVGVSNFLLLPSLIVMISLLVSILRVHLRSCSSLLSCAIACMLLSLLLFPSSSSCALRVVLSF